MNKNLEKRNLLGGMFVNLKAAITDEKLGKLYYFCAALPAADKCPFKVKTAMYETV
jgi:hypothetical protein